MVKYFIKSIDKKQSKYYNISIVNEEVNIIDNKRLEKEYMEYKLEYVDDLRECIQSALDEFGKTHSDKKMNELAGKQLSEAWRSIKALIYFPQYKLPD